MIPPVELSSYFLFVSLLRFGIYIHIYMGNITIVSLNITIVSLTFVLSASTYQSRPFFFVIFLRIGIVGFIRHSAGRDAVLVTSLIPWA